MRLTCPRSALLLACLLLDGCAHTAQVAYWSPGELTGSQTPTVAVIPFRGEQGRHIASLLESRLAEEQGCLVADATELGQAVIAAGYPAGEPAELPQILADAQSAGVDRMIIGEVLERHCAERSGGFNGGTTIHAGAVRIAFRLVDAKTGSVRVEREIGRRAERRVADGGSADDLLRELTEEAVDEFVAALLPRPEAAQVELAVGDWYTPGGWGVRRGARLARQGAWDEAVLAWERVLSRHPDSDAALFNLAIAAGQRQDFCAAEDYAMQALRLRHTDCYARGLEQLRQFQADYDRIERLRSGVVPASHTAWRE
jgi:tetratricopeptide (TPR) repeat protein